MRDRTEQVSNEEVEDRLPMAHPDTEWVGFGTKPCLRFERCATERNALAAEFQGVRNDRVQQAEVDRQVRAAFTVEADEVADCCIAILHCGWLPASLARCGELEGRESESHPRDHPGGPGP